MAEEPAVETANENPETDEAVESTESDSNESETSEAEASAEGVDSPEFAELKENNVEALPPDLNRLNDVQVTVSAELGRTKVPIEQLLKLNQGSVFELNRSIESPVELIAQGVPLGNGEVVVVDGNFAIRIQEIYPSQ